MLVGAKVCDLTEDLFLVCMWFVCGNFDVLPKRVVVGVSYI